MNADVKGEVLHFATIAGLIAGLSPDRPVHCYRSSLLTQAGKAFAEGFPGETMYAVKCNAHPLVLRALFDAGVRSFDVASDHEIALVRQHCPDATLYYHHPAKTPASIRQAYEAHGVRYFVVDCEAELAKVLANTGADAAITVRIAVPQDLSVYDLSTKFGATVAVGKVLMRAAADAGRTVGVSFHVGSQCLHPEAYGRAMRIAATAAQEAGVTLAFMDVGGGFPGYYKTTDALPWDDYFATIRAAADEVCAPTDTRVLCEPGRALVYGAASLLTQVVLRKEATVYLNDGIFGGFAEIYWGGEALVLTPRVHRPGAAVSTETQKFIVYGPTCDGNDKLPYLVDLPVDLTDGDWVEFDQLGAYGREMGTAYNGLRSDTVVTVDAPFGS